MPLVVLTQRVFAGALGEIAPGVQVDLPLALCEALVGSGGARWVLTPAQRSVMSAVPYLSSTATRATNNANLAAMVADMDPLQVLELPRGEYELDIQMNLWGKAVRVLGAGRPSSTFNSMSGGTIIRGQINIQNAIGAEVGYLGVNQIGLTPAAYPNLITAGLSAVGDSTTALQQHLHDLSLVGRGFSSGGLQEHGVLVQNGRGAVVERVRSWRSLNNFISRASGVVFRDCDSHDAEQGAVLFKSASLGGANDCFDNAADNVRGWASGPGFQAIFSTLTEDGSSRSCNNNSFSFCTADVASGTGAASFAVFGNAASSANRGTRFIGCTSRRDGSGAPFLVNDDFSDNVVFSACTAELFSGFSFQSNATTATNLPSAVGCAAFRSGFADIVNVAGRWAVCQVNGQDADVGVTLASLGPGGFARRRRFISDASSPTPGAVAVGGGSAIAPVYDDGVTWRIG